MNGLVFLLAAALVRTGPDNVILTRDRRGHWAPIIVQGASVEIGSVGQSTLHESIRTVRPKKRRRI